MKALRDATRGGVNAVAHEFAAASGCGIELYEKAAGERYRARRVRAAGLDALNFANEGKLLIAPLPRGGGKRVCAFTVSSISPRCGR